MYQNRSYPYLVAFLLGLLILSCSKEKSFETNTPNGPGSGGTAVFTLSAASGNCSNPVIAGNFVQGTTVSTGETVTLEVDVITEGTWTMNTGTVNGLYFMGAGNFTSKGVQTITLQASGKPVAQGPQSFAVVAGSAGCNFTVAVDPAAGGGGNNPGGGTGNHFPMTQGSWWSYNVTTLDPDTLKRAVDGTGTYNGKTYQIFVDSVEGEDPDSSYYRKSGSDYYELNRGDAYSLATFDAPVAVEIPILKENLSNGTSWTSPEYSGSMSGQTFKVRYQFTCTDANATLTINNKSIKNVYIITMKSQVSLLGLPYVDEGFQFVFSYAQGVGLVKFDGGSLPGSVQSEIRNWKVN